MRLPKRQSHELRRDTSDEPIYLTPEGKRKLERDLLRLDTKERPEAIQDVSQAVQKGDLSENAEYQEARSRLSRIEARIHRIREKLTYAMIIKRPKSGQIDIGSVVTLSVNKSKKTYAIVGSQEVNAARGRISYVSPLGSALMGRKKGETVNVQTESGTVLYSIQDVK
ncbi:transcription elongation factor GreA [Patescibacteria group bacterium]|jgi:transcription elongation factor GreA|uniref:Transcription elongation factor GreA n=1 Tax=candidate division WWE3 bacterium TaxID=2053526 RepID=A0A928TRI7_UNCKA|nr:transcription elongation factor GreA [candidate division WWE3 bacterium]MCL4732241.1 transcription elongation factor GreA [Patescibacteria group bacterium]MDL1953140.1 transcription elongation factor GreA [Candidatus Uhrbacteria bacterium UHB]RIL00403.1 MAG: transcription elongation factor GreA [Candidatus Uhrbacteria bacterium]